ncbi:hypothetical protein MD484_g1459, partial [Candolleomyces efflorescens]
MSSTFAHYQGPASLPSDYDLLSRVAGHQSVEDDGSLSESETTDETVTPKGKAIRRRESLPGPYFRPKNPTIGVYPGPSVGESRSSVPTEHTPLLVPPPIPRIEEEVDRPAHDNDGKMEMFWEELKILTKYALPVFGALDTLLPSAWTSSHPQIVGLWAQRMCVVMGAMLIPILLIWFSAESLLLFLRQDPDVAHLAAVYLRWVSLGLPAYAFNCISRVLRIGFEDDTSNRRVRDLLESFRVPTRIILMVAPINAFLGWLLVWGPKPFRLGFIGAPLASAISFNLISIASLIYGVFFVDRRAWHPLSRRMFTNLGLVEVDTSFPSPKGQTASEWWAWELVALAASMLGPTVLATQSVLLVSASTTFQAPFALSVATAVRIGNLLGEGKAKRAGVSANTSIVIALAISVLTSLMFVLGRDVWGRFFNDDEEVIALVSEILPLVALFQVFDGNAAVTGGVLRARGKQLIGAVLNLSAYYLIGIPIGIYLAFTWKMGLHGLWIGLTISLVYCSLIGTYLCLKTDWNHEAEKVRLRLENEDRLRKAEMSKDGERGEDGDGYGAVPNGIGGSGGHQ